MAEPLRVLIYDVETSPGKAFVWDAKTEYIPANMWIHPKSLFCWSAKWAGEKKVYTVGVTSEEAINRDDVRVVAGLADMIRQADLIVAHNGDRFDLPQVNTRLAKHLLEPVGPVRTIDTLQLARKNFAFPHNDLNSLAQYLGVGEKMSTGGFDLWRRSYEGDALALAKMRRYCAQDVRLLEPVFDRLKPYVRGLPRLMDAAYAGERACPYCPTGSLMIRGRYRTNAANYLKMQCQSCLRYSRGRSLEKDTKLEVVGL